MTDSKRRKPLTLKGVAALVAALALYLVAQRVGVDLGLGQGETPGSSAVQSSPKRESSIGDALAGDSRRDDTQLIGKLFRTQTSDRIVEAEGEVVYVMPLDTEGSRHQNFLVELARDPQLTLKISHNIDLAPQIPGLRKGAHIRFHGEYEWNAKGGVVHWTHHDPAGRHEGGWLEYEGQRYE